MRKRIVFLLAIILVCALFWEIPRTSTVETAPKSIEIKAVEAKSPENKIYTPTVKNMLANATLPIGRTLYVYGGAWNEEDTAAGVEALSYGISPGWKKFYDQQDSSYDYSTTRYQIHDGIDCTGYVGWTMYQIFGEKYSQNGYVVQSKKMTKTYSEIFGGIYTDKKNVKKRQAGDIMSSGSHAYMVVGECKDGSVVFMHASPPAVSLCGTYTPSGKKDSEAVKLATHYMKTYFPLHYEKYPSTSRGTSYLTDYNRMQWSEEVLPDPDGYRDMWADEILADLFDEVKIYSNGERILSDASPYIDEGVTYIPLRAVAETFDAVVEWNAATAVATVTAGENILVIDTLKLTVLLNGVEDDRTFHLL